jgi:molecular chaperone DnaK
MSHLSDALSLQLLRNRVEAAKLELSALAYTEIALPLGGETVRVPVSRAQFEALCEDLFERLLEPVLFQIF